jgi:fructose/tagatose bisphosphate aldolase
LASFAIVDGRLVTAQNPASSTASMTIIHVNTELRLAWRGGIEAALATQQNEVAPYKILAMAVDAIRNWPVHDWNCSYKITDVRATVTR